MGHFDLHISAFIGTVGPGKLSQLIIIFAPDGQFYGEYTKWANS